MGKREDGGGSCDRLFSRHDLRVGGRDWLNPHCRKRLTPNRESVKSPWIPAFAGMTGKSNDAAAAELPGQPAGVPICLPVDLLPA
jgi:hypothetical protein